MIPVAGSAGQVLDAVTRARGLALHEGDTLTVVDNRGVGLTDPDVLVADQVHTSYFARNAGARRGSAPWLLFLDADVHAPPHLLDRLFADEPGPRTAVLAGAIVDEPGGPGAPRGGALGGAEQSMSQEITLQRGRWAFAQTANCAVRRDAFETVGGFRSDVRSGGDADLCWRLVAAGWELERRAGAAVVHRNRATIARHARPALPAWHGRRLARPRASGRDAGLEAAGARRVVAAASGGRARRAGAG